MVNAQRLARLHPNSYEVPTYEELDEISVGDYVYVINNDEPIGLRVVSIYGKTLICSALSKCFYNNIVVGSCLPVKYSNIFGYRKLPE
ncbi:TPA: hypothetical protein QCK11_004931 [Enterobacter asburiae]|nr:hypothetical protein [Enterobacter asburiae]